MAAIPSALYPGQIATDANYPHGKARNLTVEGDGSGTPFEQAWVNDLWGFQQALLAAAGITPSGTPDRVGASQYLDAIKAIILDELATPSGQLPIGGVGGVALSGPINITGFTTIGPTLSDLSLLVTQDAEVEGTFYGATGNFSGNLLVEGRFSAKQKQERYTVGPDANTDFIPHQTDYIVITGLTGYRNYKILDTGAQNNDSITFVAFNTGSFDAQILNPGGTTIATVSSAAVVWGPDGATWRFVKCVRVAGSWLVCERGF